MVVYATRWFQAASEYMHKTVAGIWIQKGCQVSNYSSARVKMVLAKTKFCTSVGCCAWKVECWSLILLFTQNSASITMVVLSLIPTYQYLVKQVVNMAYARTCWLLSKMHHIGWKIFSQKCPQKYSHIFLLKLYGFATKSLTNTVKNKLTCRNILFSMNLTCYFMSVLGAEYCSLQHKCNNMLQPNPIHKTRWKDCTITTWRNFCFSFWMKNRGIMVTVELGKESCRDQSNLIILLVFIQQKILDFSFFFQTKMNYNNKEYIFHKICCQSNICIKCFSQAKLICQ